MPYILATANPDKAAEILAILGGVELLPRPKDVPEVEETGETLEENAELKAKALMLATETPAIADDTGLEVPALGGLPGVKSARYAGENASYEDNVRKLLEDLADTPPQLREARFRTVATVMWPGGRTETAEGVITGTIAMEPRGDNGFGYDPVFVPDEADGRTFAELGSSEKHLMSHRAKAFRALRTVLT